MLLVVMITQVCDSLSRSVISFFSALTHFLSSFVKVAITANGEVYFFGRDQHSNVTGSAGWRHLPVHVEQFAEPTHIAKYGKVIRAVCGAEHTLLLTDKGALFGWGNSQFGQIPNGMCVCICLDICLCKWSI
jgi:alpha-tubulin suppressor-like RCC1 family protein